jgi:hypothetical protein
MKKLWLTYAWEDNEDKDIDYIVQELDKTDIKVKFDRRNLIYGQKIWTQIGDFITDPKECDAWGIVLTRNSINSKACIEELSYALNRVLDSKGEDFPLFAILQDILPKEIPPVLKIRLCILLQSPEWVNQVVAAVKKLNPGFVPSGLSDFFFKEHIIDDGYCLEIRPRFERITQFIVAVEYDEKASGNVTDCFMGPAGAIPTGFIAYSRIDSENTLTDGTHVWIWGADNEISSTYSCYLFYKKQPKRIWYGHRQKNLGMLLFS